MIDPFSSAVELAHAIKRKEISSVELLDLYIDRVERYDPEINAVVVRDFDRARAAAKEADQALISGKDLGPLHGVPMTIKEAYDVEGLPTTWGVPDMAQNIATSDADSVTKLKNAGAIFFGKTNVPFSLADFQSFNDIYGTTNNPWDVTRTPGGSSGGSSAALAAGLTGLEAGSDIGGSIRNPAHFCGIYGHKPTWGVVPDTGHALPGALQPADIAVVGPMARSAEDLALSMNVVAGPGPSQRRGWQINLPRPQQRDLRDFRVAILTNHEFAPVSSEMSDRVQKVGDTLAGLGVKVSDQALPAIDFEKSFDIYSTLLWGVMAQGLTEEEKQANRELATQLGNERSIAGDVVRYSVQEHGQYLAASNERYHLRQTWENFFQDWDILICPQMATDAFPHDHGEYLGRQLIVDNEAQDYFQQVFWAGTVTVAHLPSTVFPTGPSKAGLPIGLQAVSAEYNDYTCIEFARLISEEIGGFVPPPGYE
ncbi:MAG: amidase [Pseudomonadota bacterium]